MEADDAYLEAQRSLGYVANFWQYLARKLARLDTVTYVNFHYNSDLDDKKKGLIWVIVALNDLEQGGTDFSEALSAILEDNMMLHLYDESKAYLWKNRV